jgi:hypothetical protein
MAPGTSCSRHSNAAASCTSLLGTRTWLKNLEKDRTAVMVT